MNSGDKHAVWIDMRNPPWGRYDPARVANTIPTIPNLAL